MIRPLTNPFSVWSLNTRLLILNPNSYNGCVLKFSPCQILSLCYQSLITHFVTKIDRLVYFLKTHMVPATLTLFVTLTGPTLSVRCSYLPVYISIAWNSLTPEILAQTNFYINWIVLFANWERCEEQQSWFKGLHAFVRWFDLFELVHHHLCHSGWMFISLNAFRSSVFPFLLLKCSIHILCFLCFLLMMLLNNTKFHVFVALVSLTKIIYFGQLSCMFLKVQGHFVLIESVLPTIWIC